VVFAASVLSVVKFFLTALLRDRPPNRIVCSLNLRHMESHPKREMAEILPFRALHYNPAVVPELETVVTQPYDKITSEMQARYYAASPFNIVRVIRGREEPADSKKNNVYTRAAKALKEWIRGQILVSENAPALYRYDQEYRIPGSDGPWKRRRGFIALGRLEEYSAGVVHPHEETLSRPKADRLELLKATHAHFGQIFVLYSDRAGAIEQALESAAEASGRPWRKATDEDGTVHSVWRVAEERVIESVLEKMRAKPLVIADGHHRYETALAYRKIWRSEHADDPRANYAMMTFVPMESDGLTILPTHRVLGSLPEFNGENMLAVARQFFDWIPAQGDASAPRQFLTRLAELARSRTAFGVYAGKGQAGWLTLRADQNLERLIPGTPPTLARLDTVLLHRLLIERVLGVTPEAVREERNLRYLREPQLAIEQVDRSRANVAFLLNATPIRDVWENALDGHVLPQKSTDFYPKMLTGLAAYWLDNPAGI
jgi:uncharacterized protein (DUF1015 family)